MGTYTELYIDGYPTYPTKSQVDPVVMTIFRETDRRVFERNVSERNPYTWGHIEDTGEIETVYEYANTVANVIQRLDVMGFSLKHVRQEFEEGKEEEIKRLKEYEEETDHVDLSKQYSTEQNLLEVSTFEDWLSAFKEIFDRHLSEQILSDTLSPEEHPLVRYILAPNDGFEPYYHFPCADIRCFLRAFLEVSPREALVIQDITDLVHGGYYRIDEAVCEISIQELTKDYPVNEKVIVLTEGSIDKLVLEKSLELLYPHLSGYYSFMDFGISNAPGSAGSLINTIKAFVGSGIANRIVAIFDNDTAAYVAMRGLRKTSIPPSIKVMNYPNIDLAKSYPTLGPSGVSNLDINGLACSIELYFGVDVLTHDGQLAPIHWKGYDASLNQYQGEIMRKQELQEAFFDKLSKCVVDRTLIGKTDWSGIELILSEVFHAFQ
jgi:hypothetical protein